MDIRNLHKTIMSAVAYNIVCVIIAGLILYLNTRCFNRNSNVGETFLTFRAQFIFLFRVQRSVIYPPSRLAMRKILSLSSVIFLNVSFTCFNKTTFIQVILWVLFSLENVSKILSVKELKTDIQGKERLMGKISLYTG